MQEEFMVEGRVPMAGQKCLEDKTVRLSMMLFEARCISRVQEKVTGTLPLLPTGLDRLTRTS